jgi:hypothetical protein
MVSLPYCSEPMGRILKETCCKTGLLTSGPCSEREKEEEARIEGMP